MAGLLTDEQYLERLGAAVALRRQGFLQMALEVARTLLPEREKEPAVWHTLGQIQTDLGRFDSALRYHRTAMKLARTRNIEGLDARQVQESQTIAMGLACALMRHGQFEAAWPCWEAGRLGPSWTPWPGSAIWDGTPVENLLVQCEGGYGDVFQFMRWLPLLKQRGLVTGSLVFMVFKRLHDFCDWKALGVDVLYLVGVDQITFGEWPHATSILSLPGLLGMKAWADIPEPDLPIAFDCPGCSEANGTEGWARVEHTPPLCKSDKTRSFRVGFCWRAEENSAPRPIRSLPVEVASVIAERLSPSREILSLSPSGVDLYGKEEFSQPTGLKYEPDKQSSWRATAEYMCSLDFVLTVDTAVAHLAGLLGIPTLVLRPVASEWRWGLLDDCQPWYGRSLTCYRQHKPYCWDANEIVESTLARLEGLK